VEGWGEEKKEGGETNNLLVLFGSSLLEKGRGGGGKNKRRENSIHPLGIWVEKGGSVKRKGEEKSYFDTLL